MTATKTTASTSGTSKKAKPYRPVALFRVYDKKTGECLGYVAPSRNGKDFYHVTCNEFGDWHCDCKASIEQCCHVRAALSLCAIRASQGRPGCKPPMQPTKSEEPAAMVEVEAKTSVRRTARLTDTSKAHLNGNRRLDVAPLAQTPTPISVSMDWLLGHRASRAS
jgi:hypothetical protein